MRSRIVQGLAAAVAASCLAGAAFAHPALVASQPGPNAVVGAQSRELRLTFTEALFVNFSGVVLTDADGRKASLGRASLAPGDNRVLVIPIKTPLRPGVYTVDWHAVSADTHRITGRFHFTVR